MSQILTHILNNIQYLHFYPLNHVRVKILDVVDKLIDKFNFFDNYLMFGFRVLTNHKYALLVYPILKTYDRGDYIERELVVVIQIHHKRLTVVRTYRIHLTPKPKCVD